MKQLLYIITFYILVLNAQNANCDWRLVYEAKNWKYYRISSFDSNSIAVLGGVSMYEHLRPKLFVSTNSGDNWKQIISDTMIYQVPSDRIGLIKPNNLQFCSDRFIYLACDSGRIIKIAEDGSEWEWISYNITPNLKFLKIFDDGGRYLVSDKYLFWSSGSDTNAIRIELPDDLNLCIIQYFNAFSKDSLLLILQHTVTSDYYLIKSTNAGTDWQSLRLFKGSPNQFFFESLDYGWMTIKLFEYFNNELVGIDYFFRTQNGCKNWIEYKDTFNLPGRGLYYLNFLNRNLGIAAGSKCRMLLTKDGGASWERLYCTYSSDTSFNYSIGYALSDNKYLAFCDNGKVYKYDTLHVGVIDQKQNNFGYFTLSPNPASDYIDINLGRWTPSVRWSPSDLTIYNSLGECVINESIHPMTSSHRMNIEHLPPGLYLISINNGKELETASFIVLR